MTESRISGGRRPPIKNVAENFFFEKIYTTTAMPVRQDQQRPLIFEINALSGHVIDFTLLKLFLRVRILRANGQQLGDSDLVTFKSAPLYTLFQDLTIMINNDTVFTSRNLYPYYCNILQQLKVPPLDFNRQGVLYYDDNHHLQAKFVTKAAAAEGGKRKREQAGWSGQNVVPDWETRVGQCQDSALVECGGILLNDLSFQQKYIRDDADVRIILSPAKGKFSLFASSMNREYQAEIETAYCQVGRMKLAARYQMSKGKLDYFHVEHNLGVHIIRKDASTVSRPLWSGNIPRRIGFVFVSEEAFQGAHYLTPFAYENFNLKEFQLQIGEKRYPSEPLTMDFGAGKFLEAYLMLADNLKESLSFEGLKISKDQFEDNHFFFFIDLTTDFSAGAPYWTRSTQAPISIQMNFSEALKKNVVMLSIAEFEKIMQIDEQGRISIKDAPIY